MLFDEQGWLVYVDIPKTQEAYKLLAAQGLYGVECSCIKCKNINKHFENNSFPSLVINTCQKFGVLYTIPGEFYALGTTIIFEQQKMIDYQGFYSIYGSIKKEGFYDDIFFEFNSPLGTRGFPTDEGIILLGFNLQLKEFDL